MSASTPPPPPPLLPRSPRAHPPPPLVPPPWRKSAAAAPLALTTIEISGLQVTVPLKFRPGHMLTETQARILDAAYQRQFINNQAANIKARGERLAKATTDAERAANAVQTAEQIAALYTDYEPAVGGTPRQSALEKLRHDMAHRYWTARVASHNEALRTGMPPVILNAKDANGLPAMVSLDTKPKKTKEISQVDHEAALQVWEDAQAGFRTALLGHKTHGPAIAAMVEAELAAKKEPAAPAAGAAAVVTGAGLLD